MEYITTPTVSEILREEFMEVFRHTVWHKQSMFLHLGCRISCMVEGKLRQILRFDWQNFLEYLIATFWISKMILIYEI